MSPMIWSGRRRARNDSAISLVTKSAMTTASAVPQNSRRSAAFTIFFPGLAFDAETGVGKRVETVEADRLAALLAAAELLRRAVEPAQRLVHVPEVAPFLRREQERLLALHRVGALVGHMERVAGEIAVGRLEARVERFAVVPQLLDHARPLFEQPLFEMGQLLFIQTGFGLHLRGFRRHYLVPPFLPSWRRSPIVTWRPSMSTSRCKSGSSSVAAAPSTIRRASTSPSTNP